LRVAVSLLVSHSQVTLFVIRCILLLQFHWSSLSLYTDQLRNMFTLPRLECRNTWDHYTF
jgi:hypothetical protein